VNARFRKFMSIVLDAFWIIPGAMVVCGIVLAWGLVRIDRSDLIPQYLLSDAWLYNGGGTGARTLLGAVTSSTIGVAGTVFSITIAALSLAAGQMGPRLLRNFTQDRGNQITLGAFLGTFSYALIVLRSVRTVEEGEFVPHLALSVAIVLAFACVATLVFFVGHMAGRINVDTVIELVSEDVRDAMKRLTLSEPPPQRGDLSVTWDAPVPVFATRQGYLQQLDQDSLADWAAEHGRIVRLLVRPGDYIFPRMPVAILPAPAEGAEDAFRNATALGSQRVSASDLEFAIRQLVEIAVRALSPGINDPHTAISALNRMGSILCDMVPLHLPDGVTERDGRPALIVPAFHYSGLVDAMFHMIRQSAKDNAAVLIRVLEILTAVASVEPQTCRLTELGRHADLLLGDAERNITTPADLVDIRQRHRNFEEMAQNPPLGELLRHPRLAPDVLA
jgi:uncharacterized membrane protein